MGSNRFCGPLRSEPSPVRPRITTHFGGRRSVRSHSGNAVQPTLGATLAFMIARYFASDWVSARAGERLAALVQGVEEEGWRFVAFVRLVPLFPFNLVNYAFGVTRIRRGEYVI